MFKKIKIKPRTVPGTRNKKGGLKLNEISMRSTPSYLAYGS
jgi:hypothetical protein